MTSPCVSIVLPVYNGSRYLRQAVDSILAQTCRDWELIIVDDASTDETPRVVTALSASDARIRGLRLDRNRRLPAALNRGFEEARGQYFTWTSDDNMFRPQAIEEMVAVLEAQRTVDIVYADRTYIDEEGQCLRSVPVEPVDAMADHNPVGACFLFRRHIHEALQGYDESLFLAEDYDFWLRASCRFKFCALHQDLYLYREHGASLSGKRRDDVIQLTDRLLEQRVPALSWMSRAQRAVALLAVAERYRNRADGAGVKRVFRKALACAPLAALRDMRSPALVATMGSYRLAVLVRALFARPSK